LFENRVARIILGCLMEEVKRGWRKLHNEELHDIYSSNNAVMTKPRTVRWAGYVAGVGEKRHANTQFRRKPEGRKCLEDISVNVEILLKWILRK
jgi:hypothetical protein